MKIKEVITEQYILSSADQDARLNKIYAAKGDEGFKLLYMWTKQGVINFKEFKELIQWYTKE